MESLLSCLLDVTYHVLGDVWHCIAWVRKKVKASRMLGFMLSLLLLVCAALQWSVSAKELGVHVRSVMCREESRQLQEWTGVTQKRMCLRVGDVHSGTAWAMAKVIPSGDGHRSFCIHVHWISLFFFQRSPFLDQGIFIMLDTVYTLSYI